MDELNLDLLTELIILGAKQKKEIECENVHEAVNWRQQVYGKKKQLMKPTNYDLASRNAAAKIETKVLDKDKKPIRFNGADYKAKLSNGDFSPCYFVIQPAGTDTNRKLSQILAQEIEKGELPSQIREKEYLTNLAETTIGKAIAEGGSSDKLPMIDPYNPIAPASPFDALRKAQEKKDNSEEQ